MVTFTGKTGDQLAQVADADALIVLEGAALRKMLKADAIAMFGGGGEPIVHLSTGQSNANLNFDAPLAWTPPSNLSIWNWSGTTATVGTAFAAPDATQMHASVSYAAQIAIASPGRQVYLIWVAHGGKTIDHWKTGASSPDAYADIQANVTAALAVIGVDKINALDWWQGESQTGTPDVYVADFKAVMTRFKAESWFPATTPVIIYAISKTSVSTFSYADQQNLYLQACAGDDPDYLHFVYTPSIPDSYWNNAAGSPATAHMSGAGYELAGRLAAQAYLSGITRSTPAGTVYDPVSTNRGWGTFRPTARFTFSWSGSPNATTATVPGGTGFQVIGADANVNRFLLDGFNATSQTLFTGRAADGTISAPSAVQAGSLLTGLSAIPYGSTGYAGGSRVIIGFFAAENNTDTAHGTEIRFGTTPIGTDAFAYSWKISDAGNFAPLTTNTFDLGTPSLAVRTGYFGTSIISPLHTGGTANNTQLVLQSTSHGTPSGDSIRLRTTNILYGAAASQGMGSGGGAIIPTFQIYAAAGAASFSLIRQTTPGGGGALFVMGSSNSTPSTGSYSGLTSGNGLGSLIFVGDVTSSLNAQGAAISAVAEGTWSATSAPAYISLSTTASGAISQTERVRINSTGAAFFPGVGTTASAANAFLDSGSSPVNQLLRSTSSIRYKRDIEDLGLEHAVRTLSVAPKYYRSRIANDNQNWSWYGFLAEEMAAVDPRLVHYGYRAEDWQEFTIGKGMDARKEHRLMNGAKKIPDGVMYERLTVHHHKLLQAIWQDREAGYRRAA